MDALRVPAAGPQRGHLPQRQQVCHLVQVCPSPERGQMLFPDLDGMQIGYRAAQGWA
jgi:hypothetical protein